MAKTVRDLNQAIEKNTLPKVLFLIYEEPYLVRQWTEKIIRELVAPGAETLDLQVFSGKDAEELDLARVKEACQAPPFISERKVVYIQDSKAFQPGPRGVKGAAFQDDVKDLWIDFLQKIPDGTLLMFKEEKIDKRQKKFWQGIEEAGGWIVEITKPNENELLTWLSALAAREGIQVTKNAAYELLERCDYEMTTLYTELLKLCHYLKANDETALTPEVVEQVARPNLQGDVFKLLDAMAAGDLERAFVMKKRLLERREPLQLIQFMLARKIRQLLVAKDLQNKQAIAKRLKVPPFVAGKLMTEARRFSKEVLEQHYRTMFLTDWQVKSGLIKDDIAFDLALLTGGTR